MGFTGENVKVSKLENGREVYLCRFDTGKVQQPGEVWSEASIAPKLALVL